MLTRQARAAPIFYYQKRSNLCGLHGALANGGRIPIARRLLAGGDGCIPHLGSDPYWRICVDVFWLSASIPGRVVRPAAQSLVLLRKRKVTQRRAPQLSAPSAVATGTCGARFGRGLAKLAGAQTDASPDPPKAVLLGAHRWGPRGAGSARLCRASRLRRELGVALGLVHIGKAAAFVHFRFLGSFLSAKKTARAYGIGASSSCFLLSKEKQIISTALAVANGVGSRLRAELPVGVSSACPHSYSDPFGGLGATGIPDRDMHPAATTASGTATPSPSKNQTKSGYSAFSISHPPRRHPSGSRSQMLVPNHQLGRKHLPMVTQMVLSTFLERSAAWAHLTASSSVRQLSTEPLPGNRVMGN